MKLTKLQYFAFLYISDGFLNFWWCSFIESLPNRTAMLELSSWSASNAWQVMATTFFFSKTVARIYHSPLWHEDRR